MYIKDGYGAVSDCKLNIYEFNSQSGDFILSLS